MSYYTFHGLLGDFLPTFELFNFSNINVGASSLDPNLTVNNITVTPMLRLKGGDANWTKWPVWGYGGVAPEAFGSGGILNDGSPLLGSNDDSINLEGTRYYKGDTIADYDIGTEDIIFEAIIKYSPTSTDRVVDKISGSTGWRCDTLQSGGSRIRFTIADGGTTKDISSAAVLDANAWHHVMFFADRDEATANDGSRWFINGQESGTGVDVSAANGSLATSVQLGIGSAPDGTNIYNSNIAYLAVWKKEDWFVGVGGGTDANLAPWSLLAAERFLKLSGIYPQRALGSALPDSLARTSNGYLDKMEGSARKLYLVTNDWGRVVSRNDSLSTNIKGYLSETASTNHFTDSEDFTNWSGDGVAVAAGGLAPNKMTVSGELIEDGTDGLHYVRQSYSTTSGLQYTFSSFVKAKNRNFVALNNSTTSTGSYFKISPPTVGTAIGTIDEAGIEDWGDGWVRCWLSYTSTSTASNIFGIYIASADGTNSFLGLSQKSLEIWGAQLEETSYPSSYIPTTTAANTREKDELRYIGDDGNLGGVGSELKGTMATDILLPNYDATTAGALISLSDAGASTDRINLRLTGADVTTALIRATGGSNGDVTGTTDVVDNVIHSLRTTWIGSGLNLYIDNVSEGTPDTTVDIPNDLDRIDVGVKGSIDQPNGVISNLRIFKQVTTKG